MLSGRLQFYKFIFTCSAFLVFEDSLCGALSCQHVIHKKVGDSVELSSCLPTEGVNEAKWIYGRYMIAYQHVHVDTSQFKDRLFFNLTDFSLTVKNLMLQDSGEYSFYSRKNKQHRDTVKVTLKVHEPITEPPKLSGNSTWDPSTSSCRVLLECISNSVKDISYKWTIGNQITNGSRLLHSFRPQNGDTSFICTIYNPVSEKSASETLKCSPETEDTTTPGALSCQHVIHKKVGDSVELSSCLSPEGVTVATWRYGKFRIANKGQPVDEKQFKDRLFFNLTDFSLTVKNLMLQDSGEYSFHSRKNKQRDTVKVTLKVHEPITEPPKLSGNSTWDPSTSSCRVLLECISNSVKDISYKWTIGNQITNGSRLRHSFRPQNGDTSFICTIYNPVSEMSASETLKCRRETEETTTPDQPFYEDPLFVPILIVAASVLLVVTAIVCYCKWSKTDLFRHRVNQSETVNQDRPQEPVYSSLLRGDADVYETIRDYENTGTGASQSAHL